jgi:hypothetical protein
MRGTTYRASVNLYKESKKGKGAPKRTLFFATA